MTRSYLSQIMGDCGLETENEVVSGRKVKISTHIAGIAVEVVGEGKALIENELADNVTFCDAMERYAKHNVAVPERELAFVVVDVGLRRGAPTRWGLLDGETLKFQAHGGDGWASISSPITMTNPCTVGQKLMLEELLEASQRLVKGSQASTGNTLESRWAFENPCYPPTNRPPTNRVGWFEIVYGATAVAASGVGGVLGVLFVGPVTPFILAAAGLIGYSGVSALRIGAKKNRDSKYSHPTIDAIDRALHDTENLKRTGSIVISGCTKFLAFHLKNEMLYWDFAILHNVSIDCAVKGLECKVALQLYSVSWPEDPLRQFQWLADTWASIELTGPSEMVSRIPVWGHEDRDAERIRWQMSSIDIEGGTLAAWIRHIELALFGRGTNPYR